MVTDRVFGVSPEQVWRPDDGEVLAVHVGDVAERCQAGEVSHEELQGPAIKYSFIQI